MEQEAAMGMLEKLGKLRKLLADYDREMQRLKTENEWLKMVLTDCFGDKSGAREHLAEELTDVVTAATTALRMLGYDEEERGRIQRAVNDKNHERLREEARRG